MSFPVINSLAGNISPRKITLASLRHSPTHRQGGQAAQITRANLAAKRRLQVMTSPFPNFLPTQVDKNTSAPIPLSYLPILKFVVSFSSAELLPVTIV
jgi:hypothetical protein